MANDKERTNHPGGLEALAAERNQTMEEFLHTELTAAGGSISRAAINNGFQPNTFRYQLRKLGKKPVKRIEVDLVSSNSIVPTKS